jgi:hypothetical protein
MSKKFISQNMFKTELNKDEVVIGDGSSSKSAKVDEVKKKPKWLVRGHS